MVSMAEFIAQKTADGWEFPTKDELQPMGVASMEPARAGLGMLAGFLKGAKRKPKTAAGANAPVVDALKPTNQPTTADFKAGRDFVPPRGPSVRAPDGINLMNPETGERTLIGVVKPGDESILRHWAGIDESSPLLGALADAAAVRKPGFFDTEIPAAVRINWNNVVKGRL